MDPSPLAAPFIAFLARALDAKRARKRDVHRLWLDAAATLLPLDDDGLDRTAASLFRAGRAAEAVEIWRLIAELRPREARPKFRLATVLQATGKHRDAVPLLEKGLAIDPDFPLGRNNLAAALIELDERQDEVIPLLEAAIVANPGEAEAWINLAPQLCGRFQLEAALAAGEQAIALAPDSPLAHGNYANALKEAQRWDEAEAHIERALALQPDNPKQKLNLGLIRLLQGKYEQGWEGYEYRWDSSASRRASRPVLPGPPWRGEPLAGKTLLLWGEEGQGDVLQFCRFVPMMADHVRRQGGRIVWNSFPRFAGLLNRSLGDHVDAYVTGGIPLLPPFDYEFPLLSMARFFETREETIPATVPYVKADPSLVAAWRDRLAGETRLKVGLAWTGNPEQGRNPFRSVSAQMYGEHFAALGEAAFYSLQVGAAAEVKAARAAGFDLIDQTALLETYDDTAAFIENLDLVVTICTSVAHLAGAMGKPVWIILDVNPHWVWGPERSDSPWYPSARLFRQKRFHDWTPVLAEVAAELRAVTGART